MNFENLKTNVASHIKTAEAKTDSEIVVVLAKTSDDYYYIPTLWAALFALVLPMGVVVYQLFTSYFGLGDVDYSYGHTQAGGLFQNYVYMAQLVGFILAFAILQFTDLKYALVPKTIKIKRARRLAREQFMVQELHATKNRTGVLLFLSLAERYVEVIADKAVYEKLDNAVWQNIVDDLVKDIKNDALQTGVTSAVDALGDILSINFPKSDVGENNQLADHLIIIE